MNEDKEAIIVHRSGPGQRPNTGEIEALSRSAGYEVLDVITQKRSEDPEYNIGSGKLSDVHHKVDDKSVKTVIFDNELGPYQKYNIGVYLPDGIQVHDRYTLILEIFEKRADTKHGQLQVELATLRYELPRVETKTKLSKRNEKPGFMGLGEYDEDEAESIKHQISRIRSELETIEKQRQKRRDTRREEGFNFVAIAGYTNSGKSTLLRRLSENHSVNENEAKHPDLPRIAESSENLFTTLDTTTRRMASEKRPILLTDTVGFIQSLPQWLVDSFRPTFQNIYDADLILLVVDSTNPVDKIHERIVTVRDSIIGRISEKTRLMTVFNKSDQLDGEKLEEKRKTLAHIEPGHIFVSAKHGRNIEKLKHQIYDYLPPYKKYAVDLPMSGKSMSLIAWMYNNASIIKEEYNPDTIHVVFEAPDSVNRQISSKIHEEIAEDIVIYEPQND